MANLKDQIQLEIRKERDSSESAGQTRGSGASEASVRLDAIRSGLDELPHTTDNYSLKVEYAVGPYSGDIAIVELYDLNGTWAARWEIAPAAGGIESDWEVTCKPHGAETYRKWFRNAENLFEYLAGTVAARVVEMEAESQRSKEDL